MDVQIKEVLTLRDLKSFVRFPEVLYRGNPYRVPLLFADEFRTLHWDKNPAFDHCEVKYWLAVQNGHIVGRIAGIINRLHIEKWGERRARFSWIDFIDDVAVSKALLGTVEAWAKEMGMQALHGPLGFTDLDPEGMLVQGFEELGTLATIYNFPYYPKHLENLGFVKDIDWVEFELSVPPEPNEKIAQIADIAMRRLKLKKLEVSNKKEMLPYAEDLFQLLNDAFQHLYGFVPLTRKQIDFYIKQYFGFIKPDFVPILLDRDGRMAAFGITMPSLSKALQKAKGKLFPFGFITILKALNKNDRADLYLVAVRPELQGKGVNAILINMMNQVYNRFHIVKVETNQELETNYLVQEQWKFFEKRQHKRRRCFIKHFAD
jgi:GNAT superfamily N-acetyltransferase